MWLFSTWTSPQRGFNDTFVFADNASIGLCLIISSIPQIHTNDSGIKITGSQKSFRAFCFFHRQGRIKEQRNKQNDEKSLKKARQHMKLVRSVREQSKYEKSFIKKLLCEY